VSDDNTRDWQAAWLLGRRIRAALLIFAALSIMALIFHDLYARRHGQAAYDGAQAIAGGYEQSRVPDAEALADERLTGDESDAGYRWAESHGLDGVAECPDYTARFRAGCVDYVTEQAR